MNVEKIEIKLRSSEWGVRVEGLRELRKIVESENALLQVNEIRSIGILELICANMKDLRSLVAAEACRCAEACGEKLGSSEILCEVWLEVVIGLCGGSAPRVVTNAADAAARAIVEHCTDTSKYYNIISKLKSIAAKARAAPARSAALRLIALGLKRWKNITPTNCESMAKEAGQCFIDRARDADAEARSAAREIFFALLDRGYTDIAMKARDQIDPATRKQLDRQRPPPSPVDDDRPKRLLKRNLQFQQAHTIHRGGDTKINFPPSPPPNSKQQQARDTTAIIPDFNALIRAHEEKATLSQDDEEKEKDLQLMHDDFEYSSDQGWEDEGPPPPPGPPPSTLLKSSSKYSTSPSKKSKQQENTQQNGKGSITNNIKKNSVSELCSQVHSSPHWDVRRDAILALEDAAISGSPEAWRAVATAALDGHHQVAASGLSLAANALSLVSPESASLSLGQSQSNYDTVLGALLTAGATRYSDARPGVRGAAIRALDAAKDAVAPSSLLAAAIAASPDIRGNKVKATLFEFMGPLFSDDAELETDLQAELFLKISSFIKTTHATIMQAKSGGGKRPVDDALFAALAHCLDQLRRLDPVGLADRAALLGPEYRRAILIALQETAPDFESLLSQARTRALQNMTGETNTLVSHLTTKMNNTADYQTSKNEKENVISPSNRQQRSKDDESLETCLSTVVAALATEASLSKNDERISAEAKAARRTVFHNIKKHKDEPAWDRFFQQIAMLLLERACNISQSLETVALWELAARHEALGLLRIMATQTPNRFLAIIDAAAARLLQIASIDSIPLELAFAAERTLYTCIKRVDAKPIFFAAKSTILSARFKEKTKFKNLTNDNEYDSDHSSHSSVEDINEHEDIQQVYRSCAPAARLLTSSIPLLPMNILRDSLPSLLPRLCQLLDAHHPPVRKAAVDSIVELNCAMSDLNQIRKFLRDDQIKLIMFYVKNKKQQRSNSLPSSL
uniref:TOG domain-containing protein n=1 Tax=Aureoumbra lagunensis TaxID=44058 RepID=A0A7S3JSN8_9STRA